MIRSLRGTTIKHAPTMTVLDVHGVGYAVHTLPSFTPLIDEECILHTYLAVREDSMNLYGFERLDELEMFELLLTISKVGPKSAMQFLSQAQVKTIKKAIINEDPSYLEKLSDISKKNAEKIVLELKGKVDILDLTDIEDDGASDIRSEVAEALIALGYSPKDARDAARELPSDIGDLQIAMRVTLATLGKS